MAEEGTVVRDRQLPSTPPSRQFFTAPRLDLPTPPSPPLQRSPHRRTQSSSPSYSPPHRPSAVLPSLGLDPRRSPPTASTSTVGPPSPLALSSIPLNPLPHHLAPFLHPSCTSITADEKTELFTTTYLRAASSGQGDTLEWLLSALPPYSTRRAGAEATPPQRFVTTSSQRERMPSLRDEELSEFAPRKWVDREARDEEGSTALGICCALGYEDAVRVLIEGGVDIDGVDRAGWTPLHWAVRNNDIPIAAYLLNHRASPSIISHKGLAPADLVKRGREGAAMKEVLKSAAEAMLERDEAAEESGSWNWKRSAKVERSGSRTARPTPRVRRRVSGVQDLAKRNVMLRRAEMAMDSAQNLEVDLHILGLGGKTENGPVAKHEDEPEQGILNPFLWDSCELDQMLVSPLDDLPVIFDVVISNMKPVRLRQYRVIPANVIFLSARYAHYFGSEEMMEELLLGAIERIEAAVHNRPSDMANCAFWLSNCLLLLYYLRTEPNLFISTEEYQVHLSDLINEIFVFVIRDAEQRIDRVLEQAMLEYEGLPGFEDVEFQDEWGSSRFVKKLTGRGKRPLPKSVSAMSIFESTNSTAAPSPPRSRQSSHFSTDATPLDAVSPRSITSILSSTLFILQIYDIPPAIVVQCFAQLMYWISCEVFNRLLTQKKYLCRSKAIQILLNASMLEDWIRLNSLPSKVASVHFTPLNQILQWLQCLSSEGSIDGIIGTTQSLGALNPLQLLSAARSYRYEVDEPRMSEDCMQYLFQMQKQWERVRTQKEESDVQAEGKGEEVRRMIDEVFGRPGQYGAYSPPGAGEVLGELLNSRAMLPFAVPSSADILLHFDAPDAFGPFAPPLDSPPLASPIPATPQPNGVPFPSPIKKRFVPLLPDDFFSVLDGATSHAYRVRHGTEDAEQDRGEGWFDWKAGYEEQSGSEDDEDEVAEEVIGEGRRETLLHLGIGK